jgi:uncharacterized membrane protein
MQTQTTTQPLARGLGWFSLGLGLAEVTAPRALAKLIGVTDDARTRTTMRAFGVREILAGLGVLARPRSSLPLWSRVVGDAIDLAFLGWALSSKRTNAQRLMGAIVSVAGVTALDVFASRRTQREKVRRPVTAAMTINKPVSEVYAFWRSLEQLPQFMDYLESVHDLGGGLSHWKAKAMGLEWDAVITEDIPGERIAWRSVEGSELPNSGTVRFAPTLDGNGTEIRVEMQFDFPGGAAGKALAKLIAGPQIKGDLRRLKQVLEVGEVVKSDASIHTAPHPAQPSKGDQP